MPVVVEEQLEVAVFAEHPVFEDFDQTAELLLQKRVLPYAVKACIGLQDVEVCVHGLAFIGILVAEAHVLDLFPCAGECLEITVLLSVEAVVFDRAEELYSIFERFGVAGRAVEFRQSVDGECDRVDLLLCVERGTVCVD